MIQNLTMPWPCSVVRPSMRHHGRGAFYAGKYLVVVRGSPYQHHRNTKARAACPQ